MFRLRSRFRKFARFPFLVLLLHLALLCDCYRSGSRFGPQESNTPHGVRDPQDAHSSHASRSAYDVASGGMHSCVIRDGGRVFCWGANDHGQLGDGTRKSRSQPREVKNLPSIVQLALGKHHSCARNNAGKVWCWGEGTFGQLGDNRSRGIRARNSTRPVAVKSPTLAIDIRSGDTHSCLRSSKRNVYCWGDNRYGQVGNFQQTVVPRPTEIRGAMQIEKVAAGSRHSCALRQDGIVLCWGANELGQLGNGKSRSHSRPGRVVGGTSNERVYNLASNGSQTCTLSRSGIRCWGAILGQGSSSIRRQPELLKGSAGSQQLAVGTHIVCASQGRPSRVSCWGNANELQATPFMDPTQSRRIAKLSGVRSLSAGHHHQCAIRNDQSVWCWGHDQHGSLGQSALSNAKLPTLSLVADIDNAVKVVSGQSFSCALRRSGTVACWGKNDTGQLSLPPSIRFRNTPTDVHGLAQVIDIAAGASHACAVTRAGKTYCWGANDRAQIDNSRVKKSSPSLISGINYAQRVAIGREHTCVLDRKRSVWCWGDNRFGQLGRGSTGQAREVPEVRGTAQLVAGDFHNCVIRNDGTVWCWGDNRFGQLGNAAGAAQLSEAVTRPVRIAGPGLAQLLSAGAAHTCAQMKHGKLHCWGRNNKGQMGNGTFADSWTTPVPVPRLANIQAISSFGDTNCAVQPGRPQLWCWGGLNFVDDPESSGADSLWRTPRTLYVLDTDQLALSQYHGCARLRSGRIACWGASSEGQRGSGKGRYIDNPLKVGGLPK